MGICCSLDEFAGLPQGSVLAPVLYSLYINDAPAEPGIHVAQFADDTCIYATEKHERHVFNKLQRVATVWGHGISTGI
jgi:hypothetical protein